MTQAGYRHRIIVMDRSGSIADILAGQQNGLKELFGSEAAVPGKVTFSLWDFDTEVRCVHSFASLDAVKGYEIKPRGWTALHDAVGDTVTAEGEKLAALPEGKRPEDVTVVVATDGQENRSQRRTGAEVTQMLSRQQDEYQWRVIYMGTNQDALAEGAKIGARANLTLNYLNTNDGSRNTWSAASSLLSRAPVATASPSGYNFNEAERAKAEQ